MPPDLHEVRRRLADARDDLARRYPIRRLGVFGSVARGEAGPDSDVDVLVEFGAPVGFEVVDLAMELEALLGHPVDLVTRGALRERAAPYVYKDLVYV
jgi:predicted nucleotidyltransferase